MREVAAWLERLTAVGIPQLQDEARWLRDLPGWCAALGLGYPACFVEPTEPVELRTFSVSLGAAPARRVMPRRKPQARAEPAASRPKRPLKTPEWPYWHENPATHAYKAMLRHLRRHVARRAEPYAIDFLSNPDPIRIARLMRSSRTAMVAFAEMLWSGWMEEEVMRRRWPYRPIEHGGGGFYTERISPPSIAYDVNLGVDRFAPEMRAWVEYQACGALMVARWREAQKLALASVQSGVADWREPKCGEARSWATVHAAGELRFVAIEQPTGLDWSLQLPDKARRREAWLKGAASRLREVEAECVGPCLSWSERDGWAVTDSLAPTTASAVRHRLLGIEGGRPKLWLFVSGGLFVARACGLKLQVAAETPKDAIEGLRKAVRQHRRTYPPEPVKRSQPLACPRPVRDHALHDYERQMGSAMRDYGFWRGASLFHSAAKHFLEAVKHRDVEASEQRMRQTREAPQ